MTDVSKDAVATEAEGFEQPSCEDVFPYFYPDTWEEDNAAPRPGVPLTKEGHRFTECRKRIFDALKECARDMSALKMSSAGSREAIESLAIRRVLCATSDTCCPDRGTAMRTARRFICAAADNELCGDIDGALRFALILVDEDIKRAFGLEVWRP